MKIILMNKKIICGNNLKANGKIPLACCQGNQGDAHFRVGLQKDVIPAALESSMLQDRFWVNTFSIYTVIPLNQDKPECPNVFFATETMAG